MSQLELGSRSSDFNPIILYTIYIIILSLTGCNIFGKEHLLKRKNKVVKKN